MSIFHFMIGIGVGLLGLFLVNRQQITNGDHFREYQEQPRNSTRRNFRPRPNTRVGDNCSICLTEMGVHDIRPLICGHALHKKCYDECISRRINICPLCKERM